jgi:hypothetical protein
MLKTIFFLKNQAPTQNVFLKRIYGIAHETSRTFEETKAEWFEQLKERNELHVTESIEFTCLTVRKIKSVCSHKTRTKRVG